MNDEPVPTKTRWMVWTDHEGERERLMGMRAARWFWAASGPRGHMSGAEASPQAAIERAWGAYQLLFGDHERQRNEKAAS